MTLRMAVALRLKNLLKEKGISQYQLYKKTGVPQSTISTIINEIDKTCKLITLAQLAQGFEIGLNEFFNDILFSFENIEV